MKGSLQELVAESIETYSLAQARMNCHASQIRALRAAGVSPRRIESLYPFAVEDYAQAIDQAATMLRGQSAVMSNTLLNELLAYQLSKAYEYLPDQIVDAVHKHYDEQRLAEGKLTVLLHLFHSLALYDLSAEVLYGESETEAENAWTDALHELEPAADLLRTICCVSSA